jgi:hypothetical protein
MRNLFVKESFVSHAGMELTWKIECDALTDEDLETLAGLVGGRFHFGKVVGVPRGGLAFAEKLQKYTSKNSSVVLIVDDVFTTGMSMEEVRTQHPNAVGVVIFSRGCCPDWVSPIFQLNSTYVG